MRDALSAAAVRGDAAAAKALGERATAIGAWRQAWKGRRWALTAHGILVELADGQPATCPRTGGEPVTMRFLWEDFGGAFARAAQHCGVGVDLLMALAAIESVALPGSLHRNACSERHEPGYLDVKRTSNKVSVGLLQTLVSTARSVAGWAGYSGLTLEMLRDPTISVSCGAAYLRSLWLRHNGDPVLAQAGYNAGGIYASTLNPWHLRTYSPDRTDRFIAWYNDCHAWLLDRPDLAALPLSRDLGSGSWLASPAADPV